MHPTHTDKLGRVAEAREMFEDLLRADGPFARRRVPPAAYFSLGKILYDQGHHAETIALLQSVSQWW